MPTRDFQFGFSPCPNDAFAFWAAVHRAVSVPGVGLSIGAIADIEALNRRALGLAAEPPLPVTKLSIPALAAAARDHAVLAAGAALGFGCGPLVVRCAGARVASLAELAGRRVAIPGRWTTAFALFSLFGPRDCDFVEMRFDAIMPSVSRGECDAGLVIHEGRFTYAAQGLEIVADLGVLWEQRMHLPLPLGVIAMRREYGAAAHRDVSALLRASVECARKSPALPRPFVRELAQEVDDEVCDRHIGLYVNEFTVDLGERGRRAIDALLAVGREALVFADGPAPWLEEDA